MYCVFLYSLKSVVHTLVPRTKRDRTIHYLCHLSFRVVGKLEPPLAGHQTITDLTHEQLFIHTYEQHRQPADLVCMFLGENHSAWRKPIQAQGEYGNSTQKGHWVRPKKLLAVRQQCQPQCCQKATNRSTDCPWSRGK